MRRFGRRLRGQVPVHVQRLDDASAFQKKTIACREISTVSAFAGRDVEDRSIVFFVAFTMPPTFSHPTDHTLSKNSLSVIL